MSDTPTPPPPPTLAEIGRPGKGGSSRPRPDARASVDAADPAVPAAGLRASDGRAGVWRTTVQWITAALITLLLAWLTYTRDGWVPFLSGADLAIHEFGHLLTMWAPPLVCSLAGSVLQVATPLALAGYFWWRTDGFAAILCTAWAAESLHNVSVYVGDAQAMVLPLFGDDGSGAGHDWHNTLRDTGLLGSTDAIANAVFTGSVILFVVALGMAALAAARARQG